MVNMDISFLPTITGAGVAHTLSSMLREVDRPPYWCLGSRSQYNLAGERSAVHFNPDPCRWTTCDWNNFWCKFCGHQLAPMHRPVLKVVNLDERRETQ